MKTPSELADEARIVKKYIREMPPLPKKAGEVYYIVAMDWFEKWKKYTGYDNVKLNTSDSDTPTPGEDNHLSDASTTINNHDSATLLSDKKHKDTSQ